MTRSSIFFRTQIYVVSILKSTPNHIPLKYRCPNYFVLRLDMSTLQFVGPCHIMPHLPQLPLICVFVYVHTSQGNPSSYFVEAQLTNWLHFSFHNTTKYIIILNIVFSVIYRLELHNAVPIYCTSHFYRKKSQIDCSDSIEH
jgi:hypothetical protein